MGVLKRRPSVSRPPGGGRCSRAPTACAPMAARLSSGRASRAAAMADARLFMSGSPDRDEVNRTVLAALFVRVPLEKESTILAPVITLQVPSIANAAQCPSDANRILFSIGCTLLADVNLGSSVAANCSDDSSLCHIVRSIAHLRPCRLLTHELGVLGRASRPACIISSRRTFRRTIRLASNASGSAPFHD